MHFRILSLAFFAVASCSFAGSISDLPACGQDTLTNYQSNYSPTLGGACNIGNLTYSKFFFTELKVTPSSSLTGSITADDLIIVPVQSTNSFNILPSDLSFFNRVITVPERYLITYNVDPPPIIAGDRLDLDPPVGSIYGTKWGCIDSDFTPSIPISTALQNAGGPSGYSDSTFSCGPSATKPYILKTNGTSSTFEFVSASIVFDEPAAVLNIRLVLDFLPGTISGFEGIQQPVATTIPEPSTFALAGLVLAGVALKRFRA